MPAWPPITMTFLPRRSIPARTTPDVDAAVNPLPMGYGW